MEGLEIGLAVQSLRASDADEVVFGQRRLDEYLRESAQSFDRLFGQLEYLQVGSRELPGPSARHICFSGMGHGRGWGF